MTAGNINIDEFIKVLKLIKGKGYKLIDLEMLPDDTYPDKNKLVIQPVIVSDKKSDKTANYTDFNNTGSIEITDPNIDRTNNDIFNSFDL